MMQIIIEIIERLFAVFADASAAVMVVVCICALAIGAAKAFKGRPF